MPMNLLRKGASLAFKNTNLLYTNVLVSFTLSGVGDVIEQKYEMHKGRINNWDKMRTAKMTATGAPIGIFCHYYYKWMDKYLPGRRFGVLIKKLTIDQLICSPLCISGFLVFMAVMNGSTMVEFAADLKKKGLKLYTADCLIWPPAQVVNFYFLPPQYRVLYDNTISLGFDIYTSYVNYNLPVKTISS